MNVIKKITATRDPLDTFFSPSTSSGSKNTQGDHGEKPIVWHRSNRCLERVCVYIFCLLSVLMVAPPLHASAWFGYDRAISAAQRGDWEMAKQSLKDVLINSPDRPDLLYDAGVASYKTKDFSQAAAYFNRVTELDAASTVLKEQAHFNQGNVSVELKKLEDAVKQYEKVLSINPGNEHAKHNLDIVKKMLE